MRVLSSVKPRQGYLGPDGLRLAAEAYEGALHIMNEDLAALPPHRARRLVARYVMHEALRGQRDPVLLREGAMKYLRRVAR
jgi:hypothetical protein